MANDVISSINFGSDTHVFTTPYGVCNTAAATTAKTVTVEGDFVLETGARVVVKFTYGNSANTISLNVNGTGAKDVYLDNDIGNTDITTFLKAGHIGRMFEFVYDGTRWQLLTINQDTNTIYTHPTSAGYKHVPSGGAANNYLGWSSAGTATWKTGFGKAAGGSGIHLGLDLTSNTLNTYGGGGSLVSGFSNTISGAIKCGFVFGQSNTMSDTTSESTESSGSYSRFNTFIGYTNSFTVSSGGGTGCVAIGLFNKVGSYTTSFTNLSSSTWKAKFGSVALGSGNTAGSATDPGIAIGYNNTAAGTGTSAAIGSNNTASKSYAYSFGRNNSHSSGNSVTIGHYLTALYGQTVLGYYNNSTATSSAAPTSLGGTTGSVLQFGWGTSSARKNLFNLQASGNLWITGTYNTSGADYAEYFEWSDQNRDGEDRRGRFVTLDQGDKIRFAQAGEDYILGVVSAFPSVVGDSYEEEWKNRYLKDVYGSYLLEERDIPAEIDEVTGDVIVPASRDFFLIDNPEYDPEEKYVPRKDRPEWTAVGMMGKLVVDDDGTCEVNGYAAPGVDGIATKGTRANGYRVLARLDETHVKILFK